MWNLLPAFVNGALVVSTLAYLNLIIITFTVKDGPAWAVYRWTMCFHLLVSASALWLVLHTATVRYEAHHFEYLLIGLGRLGGAIGNAALTLMLYKSIRKPDARTRKTDRVKRPA